MAQIRKTYNWYIERNQKPPSHLKPRGERKTYNWYIQRGLTPPSHLSVPKVIKGVGHAPVFIPPMVAPAIIETDEQVAERIKVRFSVLETLVADVVQGNVQGLIVSGPPGLGKSYTVEQKIKNVENTRIVKGHASAKGLYELLYDYREEGSIVVMDDCDSIFTDEKALNLLKTALDTTEERVLSWVTSGPFGASGDDDDGRSVPTSYVFEGSIIFITNLDFDGMILRQSKIAKHLEALISRCHYIDLLMKSARDYVIRIKQVVRETKMLASYSPAEVKDVIKFIEDNQPTLREISLRTALKVATLRKGDKNWQNIAKITCCKI